MNSPGEQDLIIYAISDNGRVGVSNYEEATLEDECMHDIPDAEAFGSFYQAQFAQAVATTGAPKWLLEYGWSSASCDPCAEEPISDEEVQAFGFEGTSSEAYLSRIHMRYGPSDITQDLALYASGETTSVQVRYIQYVEELEEFLPVCGIGMVEDGGSCEPAEDTGPAEDTSTPQHTDHPSDDEHTHSEETTGCSGRAGCGHTPLQWSLVLVGLSVIVSTRRREPTPRLQRSQKYSFR